MELGLTHSLHFWVWGEAFWTIGDGADDQIHIFGQNKNRPGIPRRDSFIKLFVFSLSHTYHTT
jgi:hypothetical protein